MRLRIIGGRFREPTSLGKSCAQAGQRFLCGAARLPSGRFADLSRVSENRLHASDSNRAGANDARVTRVSIDGDYFPDGFFGNSPEAIFAPIIENQLNRRSKAFATLLNAVSLAI